MACGDVEKSEFIGAGFVLGDRRRNRIAGIAQIDKIHALDDAAILHIKTRNDADLEHVSGRRPRVAQVDEIDALDDAAVLHVEAGNDADLEHGITSAARRG